MSKCHIVGNLMHWLINAKVTPLCHVATQCIQELVEVFYINNKNAELNDEQEK